MSDLRTDFKDDVLNIITNEKRKYKMINNADGTVSFEDVTDYVQQGDTFGATEVNLITEKVNSCLSKQDIVDNLENTAADLPLSANQGKILNDKIEAVETVKLTSNVTLKRYGKYRELVIEGEENTGHTSFNFAIPEEDRPSTGIRFYGKDTVHGICEFFIYTNNDANGYAYVGGIYIPPNAPSSSVSASGSCYARGFWLLA